MMRFLPELTGLDDSNKKLFWFCGLLENNFYQGTDTTNQVIGIVTLLINHYIWGCKIRKARLSVASLSLDIECSIKKAFALSRKLRLKCKKINLTLFRNWAEHFDDGGERGEEEEEEHDE
jgi:hypothetical protein